MITLGISGPRHGMTLKLTQKKFLVKRWLLMISSTGSRNKSPFYKPENKFKISVITEEAGFPWLLDLC